LLGAAFAPLLSAWGPEDIDFSAFLVAPGPGHIMGTDGNGMDIWSRILYAARIDLGVALGAVALAVCVGSLIGGLVGYIGGWVDEIAMRITDIVQAFPAFILALTVSAMFGGGLFKLTLVIGFIFAPAYIRIMRGEIRALRERTFVEAAECSGNTRFQILVRHLFPNALTPLLVIAPLNCGWAMLTLAGLSFLGLGVPIPEAEWGAMISAGAADVVGGRWWTSIYPGMALFISVLSFNLIGEGFLERSEAM
ncbi:MAG: ABC transporter permease, partial [Proteobacteria bacterium]|nr:ABC transporter permease [Pseudomonadota bacterium]